MTRKQKLGPVSAEERAAVRARLGSDLACGRPTESTAGAVWTLLEDTLPLQLDDLIPKRGKGTRPVGPEYEQDVRIAKQSLVLALDCAIATGDRGEMLTKNVLFDALAPRWSRRYRRARRRGARVSYDMRTATVECALRELLAVGVRFDTLWTLVSGGWSRNPLFSVRRVSKNGHPLGYSVDVTGSSALRDFEDAVETDGQYRRRRQKYPLLLAEDWTPRRRRMIHQKVCAERPYNIVNLGEGSERVLSILEGTQVQFNVEIFRDDYETLSAYLDSGHRPSTQTQRRNYRNLTAFLASYRRLYRQTETITVETLDDLEGPPIPLPRRPWIRSRFFRALNRRYHAMNFWPERVHKDFRERWFSLAVHVPEQDYVEPGDGPNEPEEHVVVEAHTAPGRYVERDIVTSQIQTLSVFLGIDDLERLAASERPTLKEWLADRLWTLHLATPGGLLADGYKGPQDHRLIAFAKKHLMRFYGADLSKLIRECGKDPEKYGPGWRTTRGLWSKLTIKPGTRTVTLAKSGVGEAVERATTFFVNLPPWIDTLETFLAACRALAEKTVEGVTFHDPLDGAEVRWHHAQRGTDRVGHDQIEVRPPGKGIQQGFVPLPAGTIDRPALKRFVAPCLTHMLDAYFSSLVLERLQAAGITDVVALHDAWLVPETLPVPGEPTAILSGNAVLKYTVEAAGEPWLVGLGDIYDRLVSDLGDDLTFGPFVREIQARWRARVDAKHWPRFLSD